MKKFVFFIIFFFNGFSYSEDHSVIALMYHRFDEPKYQSTSISSKLFEKHLKLIKDNDFNVLNLKDFLDILINKKKVPQKTLLMYPLDFLHPLLLLFSYLPLYLTLHLLPFD